LAWSAASGSDWTFHHLDCKLDSYNMQIEMVGQEEFFEIPELPATTVDPMILNNIHLALAED
jgi:hypothetical protein